jgi:hypothetical protein
MTKMRALVGLIFIAILVYSGLWYTSAFKAEKATAALLADLRDKGLKVDHGKIKLSGFPYRFILTIDGLSVRTRADGLNFGAESVRLISHLWTPGHWMADGDKVTVALADGALKVSDGYMRASYVRHSDNQAVIVVDSLDTDDFSVEAAPGIDSPTTLKNWQVFLRYDGTAEPQGGLYEKRFLDFKLVLDNGNHMELMGGVLGPVIKDWTAEELGRFRDEGGLLEFDSIDFAIRGARMKGNASLTLDETFRPLGSASLAVAGGPALADYLKGFGIETGDTLTGMGDKAANLSVMAQTGFLSIDNGTVMALKPLIKGSE